MNYSIINNSLLKHSIDYSFSEYLGNDFIKDYINSRKSFIDYKKNKHDINYIIQDYMFNLDSIAVYSEKSVSTLSKFKFLVESINSHNINKEYQKIINIFIYKYEVFKRIYENYIDLESPEKNKRIGSYKNLSLYLIFSYLCSSSFLHTGSLKYINTSLKVNDMLCSAAGELATKELDLLSSLLYYEIELISDLFNENGIQQ